MSETWHPLIATSDFPEEGKLAVRVAGWYVLVVRTESGFTALNDRCTHQASLLSGGRNSARRGDVPAPRRALRSGEWEVHWGDVP